MDGSPQLLTDVKFTQLRKGGYDPEEVDNYLERINDAVAKLAEKLRTATEQAESAQAQLAEARRAQSTAESELERLSDGGAAAVTPVGGDEELAKVLVLAQRAADQAIEEANATATRTVADARAKSVNLLAEAEQERERLLVKAHKKADAAAEERARHLSEQVDALAAARADLEADVEALQAHLDGERDRLRERIDSVRQALDDPDGLRLAQAPELHDTPVPVVDLPGLDGADAADEVQDHEPDRHEEPAAEAQPEPAEVTPEAADAAPEPVVPEAAAPGSGSVAPEAVMPGAVVIESVVETGIEEPTELAPPPPPPAPEPAMAPLSAPPVEATHPEPPSPSGVSTDTVAMPAIVPLPDAPPESPSTAPQPELVPLVAPEADADPGAGDTIYLDVPPPPPADTKQVEAQLFAGDPVADNRAFVESSNRAPSDLFARDEDSPLGEPDEEADAAMKAFFERDLDDPTIAGRGRFGRRR